MDEIAEYERQLAEVSEALKANKDEELIQLETELKSLISDLRDSLPKYSIGEEVSTKTVIGKILEVKKNKMYKVQPFNESLNTEGDPILVNESSLRKSPFPIRNMESSSIKQSEKSVNLGVPTLPVDESKTKQLFNPTVNDEFEESKAKWKKFSKAKTHKFSTGGKDSGRISKRVS